MTTYERQWSGGWVEPVLPLTWSAEDSPANRSHLRGSNMGSQTNDGSGPRSLMSSMFYDPASSSWRTSGLWSETDWPSVGFSATFTDSGSMQSGRVSPRAPWVLHTHDIGCSSWLTPVARDHKGYTKRAGESVCNQLREIYGGSGSPNPRWLEWLMGFPAEWTEPSPSATPSSPRLPNTSDGS